MSRPRFRLRFSIAGLMGLVLFSAVGFAALEHPSDDWASLIESLTLLLLATAILGAIHRRGPARAFWTGFSLVGWVYLILTLAPWFAGQVRPWLITSRLLDSLYAQLPSHGLEYSLDELLDLNGGDVFVSGPGQLTQTGNLSTVTTALAFVFSGVTPEPFQRVGHSLLALIFAYLGALTARRLLGTG